MLKIAICDNEYITVNANYEKISAVLNELGANFNIDMYTDSGKLLSELYNGKKWDIYFLDIDMPIVGGFELGEKIRSLDSTCYLIYVSIHREKVYQSFKTRPFRFLPKDEFNTLIYPCVEDILNDMKKETQSQNIVLEICSSIYRYSSDKTMYVQSFDKYIQLFFEDGSKSELMRYKISSLEVQLCELGFIRTHKSYLVNYRFIRKILPEEIVLDNGTSLPISRARADAIKSAYRRLML